MQWVTTYVQISSAKTIEPTPESFIDYRTDLVAKAGALGVTCREAPMTNFFRVAELDVAVCGGNGDPVEIMAYRR